MSASVPGTYSDVVRGTSKGVPEVREARPEVRVVRQDEKRDWAVRREVKEVLSVESSVSSWRFIWRRVEEGRVRRSICEPADAVVELEEAGLGGIGDVCEDCVLAW